MTRENPGWTRGIAGYIECSWVLKGLGTVPFVVSLYGGEKSCQSSEGIGCFAWFIECGNRVCSRTKTGAMEGKQPNSWQCLCDLKNNLAVPCKSHESNSEIE